jgi:ethanolamine utilization cobalamin adenosyltransferase
VPKSHPVIAFRGKLDCLCARIVSAQVAGAELGRQDFVADLEEILDFVRSLLPAELRGEPVREFLLCGLDAAAVRERSHHPQKYFGHPHMRTSFRMGRLPVALNELRALTRETELAAVRAFADQDGNLSREDVVMALNRLSSLFYVLMFKYLPAGFVPEGSGI